MTQANETFDTTGAAQTGSGPTFLVAVLGRNEGAIKTLTRRAIAAFNLQLRQEVRYE